MASLKTGLFALGICLVAGTSHAADRLLHPSEIIEITPQELREEVRVSGTAVAERHTVVSARVPGQVLRVHARPGEVVREGDLLVELDETDLLIDLRRRIAALEQSRTALASARKALDRSTELNTKGLLAPSALDEVRSAHDQAEAQFSLARSDLEAAEVALKRARITAPMGGTVSGREIEPGQLIQSGAALMGIIDTERLVLEALVPFSSALVVRPGMTAELNVPSEPSQALEARVDRVNPQLDTQSRSATVYLVIENPDGALRAGAYLGGVIAIEEAPDALAVPAGAVFEADGRDVVMAVREGTARIVPVKTGRSWSSGTLLEIDDGLAAGDIVLRGPLSGLSDGDSVEIGG